MERTQTLHLLCGKLASGKTTLARQIAEESGGGSARFRRAIAPHVQSLLERGLSVVFDFGGNVPQERAWVRSLCSENVRLVLHYVKASDDLCKQRLRQRNGERPDGSQPTTDEEFDAITRYFVPPDPAEGFEVHEYDADLLRGAKS